MKHLNFYRRIPTAGLFAVSQTEVFCDETMETLSLQIEFKFFKKKNDERALHVILRQTYMYPTLSMRWLLTLVHFY